ncbi:hypothetical protein CLOM_g13937 [Closterium sp. NIES-68]|nr:hypothetical protein CLOM_g13937 [Closterium sp. NIES-68]
MNSTANVTGGNITSSPALPPQSPPLPPSPDTVAPPANIAYESVISLRQLNIAVVAVLILLVILVLILSFIKARATWQHQRAATHDPDPQSLQPVGTRGLLMDGRNLRSGVPDHIIKTLGKSFNYVEPGDDPEAGNGPAPLAEMGEAERGKEERGEMEWGKAELWGRAGGAAAEGQLGRKGRAEGVRGPARGGERGGRRGTTSGSALCVWGNTRLVTSSDSCTHAITSSTRTALTRGSRPTLPALFAEPPSFRTACWRRATFRSSKGCMEVPQPVAKTVIYPRL